MTSKVIDLGNFQKLSPGIFLLRHQEVLGATGEHSKDPTLIIVFGWMGAQLVHLFKYTQYYETLYPHATILLMQCHPSFFFKSTSDKRALLSPVADILENLGYINPESVPSGSSVLVHVFSNGGAAQVVTLSDVLKDRAAKRTHGHKDSYDIPSALILDSAPGDSSIGSAVAALQLPYGARSFDIRHVHRMAEEVMRALQRTHLLPWIGEATPRLYIYSKRDALIPYTTVARHAAQARALGYTVDTEVFDKTMHVAHMRSDPDRYWAAVQRIWRTATDAAASHP